nr:MAG TPA: hypothetical protein [Caudoviricetes sp.]
MRKERRGLMNEKEILKELDERKMHPLKRQLQKVRI